MRHREAPTNSDDMIDMRDVDARIDELKSEIEDAEDEAKAGVTYDGDSDECEHASEPWTAPDGTYHATESEAQDAALNALREEMGAEYDELKALQSLMDDVGSIDGTLIRDSYFETYARDFADDIGAIKRDMGWPYSCIDWEKAAHELQMDYTSVEFDGVDYWYRD